MTAVWDKCLSYLQQELPSQQYNTWIRPLQIGQVDDKSLELLAPNRFVKQWVESRFLEKIREILQHISGVSDFSVQTRIIASPQPTFVDPESERVPGVEKVSQHAHNGLAFVQNELPYNDPSCSGKLSKPPPSPRLSLSDANTLPSQSAAREIVVDTPSSLRAQRASDPGVAHKSNVNSDFVFNNFIVGKSNQLALAAATQVAENPGRAYNPLFIYGGVGLGKTHLMHAVGNALISSKPGARVVYLHSERFVADMVKALRMNAISDFKRYYRSVDALLIDDIQFFAKKDRSQEEFFHTFNALLEGNQQVILTCDRYPKEVDGLEERLKSRFGWGLTVAIEPPELETRVAILKKKAEEVRMELPDDAAFFIAQRIRSNVRELEGALKRVIANAHFINQKISVPLVQEALKDLLALQDRLVSIDNIQRVVAEYFKIKVADFHSKRRTRSIARPRQVAMYLAKELTNHSLPEIGDVFGGRDHTTVLHACRKVKELSDSSSDMREDLKNLFRTLST